MTDVIKQQIQHLIKLGAEQFTGGDEAIFLRLAQGGDPLRADIEAQQAEADGDTGPRPKAEHLEDSALTGGYLDNYLSLRAAGLKPEQAYFAAWFNAHPDVRRPKTVRAVARFLGRSHTVVYKWKFQDWFTDLALNRWREQLFLQHLANVDRMTISEAEALTGPAGVQARRLFYEIGLPVLGQTGPGNGVQVNVNQTNQTNTQVNIEDHADNPLDILRGRLDSLATAERQRIGLEGANGDTSGATAI